VILVTLVRRRCLLCSCLCCCVHFINKSELYYFRFNYILEGGIYKIFKFKTKCLISDQSSLAILLYYISKKNCTTNMKLQAKGRLCINNQKINFSSKANKIRLKFHIKAQNMNNKTVIELK
jgi:hypothetical protein